jgi:hypothetical protein
MDDPIQTQKEQLNRLMGRAVDTPLEIDQASIVDAEGVSLQDAYAEALACRPRFGWPRSSSGKQNWSAGSKVPNGSLTSACPSSACARSNFSSVFPNTVRSVGLQATWDVFDCGKKRVQLEIKREATKASRALSSKTGTQPGFF